MKRKPRVADGSVHLVSDSEGSDFLVILVPIDEDPVAIDFATERDNEVSH
jgi:hypothetical protein